MLEMALRAGRQGWKDLWPFMPLVGNECQQELASMFAWMLMIVVLGQHLSQ